MKKLTMKLLLISLCGVMLISFPLPLFAADEEGNWRRGRIYYRTTCTSCHKEVIGEGISPASRTIAEWQAYFEQDRHDNSSQSNGSVKYYVSHEYRELIRGDNKVANKLIDLPDEELLNDVRAFVVHGAKDSDNPTRCK